MTSSHSHIDIPDKMTPYCRLCLSVSGKLHHLFHSSDTDALAVSLSLKVALCTAVAISKYDKLPQKICQKCLNFVNDWYTFRKKCLKVNSLLKQNVISQLNDGSINEKVFGYLENGNSTKIEKEPKISAPEKNFEIFELNCDSEKTYEKALKNDLGFIKFRNVANNSDVKHTSVRRKKFNCPYCPDSFYFYKDLKLHKILLHTCEKSLSSEQALPKNESDIKLEGINMRTRYEMKCCNKVFFTKVRFRKHYNEQHPGEKPFMCETCGKKDFISEETLKRHKVLHTGKFRCDICLKTFTCNAILILHKRDKHENDKPFVCDVCGKRFVTELLMNYHKRFHTGEKKYVCEECGLAVVTSSSLAKHKRIHSKEKPHVCHICGKGFIIKGRLVEHLRTHTGERPYECSVCQKSFTVKDKLKRHMHIHTGEKIFSCEFCGHSYSTRYGLSIHLKTHLIKTS